MIPRIKSIRAEEEYILNVVFDDGRIVMYDMKEDMEQLPGYSDLKKIKGLFSLVQLDESRTCVYWNDYIDLPSDIIYEYGKRITSKKHGE